MDMLGYANITLRTQRTRRTQRGKGILIYWYFIVHFDKCRQGEARRGGKKISGILRRNKPLNKSKIWGAKKSRPARGTWLSF